jgi:hypothetical protein
MKKDVEGRKMKEGRKEGPRQGTLPLLNPVGSFRTRKMKEGGRKD